MQCKSSAQPDLLLFMETEHSKKAIAVPPRGLGYHSTNFGDVNSKRALWGKYLSGKAVSSAFPESILGLLENALSLRTSAHAGVAIPRIFKHLIGNCCLAPCRGKNRTSNSKK